MLSWGKGRDAPWDQPGGPDLKYKGEMREAKHGKTEG